MNFTRTALEKKPASGTMRLAFNSWRGEEMHMTRRTRCFGGLLGLALSCGFSQQSSEPQPKLLAHAFQPVTTASFEVGEDCSRTGPSGCMSGLCIHYKASLSDGYVCSRTCPNGVGDCPSSFYCQALLPSSPVRVCTPAPSWVSGIAQARSASVPEMWSRDGGPADPPTNLGPAMPPDGGVR